MSYEPLHHKYRPQTFKDLVGQEAIASTLINALELEKIAPAYLFTGPRGTGKTSSARILAKSLNCLAFNKPTAQPCGKCEVCQAIAGGHALDVIEIDAASNTGVDNIREIIERSRFAPVQSRYKVYAIDECHMLSTAAFNALLKTLEEPPPQVVFILATTDPQRVLSTIISRCQRFDYRRIPLEAMVSHLIYIAEQEKIAITPEALSLIAQIANGGLRDAESLLDQLSLFPEEITVDKIWDLVGAVPERDLLSLLTAIRKEDIEAILAQCRNLLDRGREPLVLLQNLANFYLNLLIAKTAPDRQDLVAVTETCWQQLCTEAKAWEVQHILQGQQQLKEGEVQIKNTTQPRLWLEVTLLGLLNQTVLPPQPSITAQKPLSSVAEPQKLSPANEPVSEPKIATVKTHKTEQQPTVSSVSPKTPSPTPNPVTPPQFTSQASEQKSSLEEPESIWQQVIDCLHPPMTQALLKQQCHLISLTEGAAVVGISSAPLLKMNQGKVPNIEAAFAKVCQRKIKVTLEVAPTKKSATVKAVPQERSHLTPQPTPITQNFVPLPAEPNPEKATAIKEKNPNSTEADNNVLKQENLDSPHPPEIAEKTAVNTQDLITIEPKTQTIEPITPEITLSGANTHDFSKAIEIMTQKFDGEIIDFPGISTNYQNREPETTFSSSKSETTTEELKAISPALTTNQLPYLPVSESASSSSVTKLNRNGTKPSSTKPDLSIPKQQKVVIKRDTIADYNDDDDVPF